MADSLILKSLAKVTDTDPDDAPHGGFEAIASTPDMDRDGEAFSQKDWGPLPDKITIDVDHSMDVRGTIGSARPFFDDEGNLRISAKFASTPLAQEVRTLMTEGHVDSVSVAFMRNTTTKSADSDEKVTKLELLNVGVVAVPSNRGAKVLSSKAVDVIEKAGARNNATDKKSIQAIHDHAASLGASCAEADAADMGEMDGANKSPSPFVVDVTGSIDVEALSKAFAEAVERNPHLMVLPQAKPAEKTATLYVAKALANSVEDLQARISDALCDVYERGNPSAWVYVQATFLDDGGKSGTVVYCLNGDSMSRAFEDDGSQVTLGDKVTDVTIITTVVPEGDGSDDDDQKAVEAGGVEAKSVVDTAWDGSASRFTIEQWRASCLIGPDTESDSKNDYKLPVKEPDGDVNSNAVHAAAAALAGGRGGVDAPADEKKAAARKLLALYRQIGDDAPDSLLELAGESPKDDSQKSADPASAAVKAAGAGSAADEEIAVRARALVQLAGVLSL